MRVTDPRIVVLDTPDALAARAADEFEQVCTAAIGERGRFTVALSGGKTPKAMLQDLAQRAIDWSRVHFFWSDERCVPPESPDSNYGMARDALLEPARVPEANIQRMKGELEPEAGARDYNGRLAAYFGGWPSFDLTYLGLGPDGHTASLFPGTQALRVRDVACTANRVGGPVASPWRLTLTYPAINRSARVIFLVEGAQKAAILHEVIDGPQDASRLPAQGIEPDRGDLVWLTDAAAASSLSAR